MKTSTRQMFVIITSSRVRIYSCAFLAGAVLRRLRRMFPAVKAELLCDFVRMPTVVGVGR